MYAHCMGTYSDRLKQAVPLYEYVYGQSIPLFKAGREYVISCPFHAESTPSCHVNEIRYHCFGCGAHGDIYDFIRNRSQCSYQEAVDLVKEFPRTEVRALTLPNEKRGTPLAIFAPGQWEAAVSFGLALGEAVRLVTLHPYTFPSGKPIYFVGRWDSPDGKIIRPFYEKEPGLWLLGKPSFTKTPLYNLQHICSPSVGGIYVTEGEKAADTLLVRGFRSTTSGGASTAARADWRPLRSRLVIIWPDNDAPGIQYALDVHQILGQDRTYMVIPAADCEKGDDAYDWYQRTDQAPRIEFCTTDRIREILQGKQQ